MPSTRREFLIRAVASFGALEVSSIPAGIDSLGTLSFKHAASLGSPEQAPQPPTFPVSADFDQFSTENQLGRAITGEWTTVQDDGVALRHQLFQKGVVEQAAADPYLVNYLDLLTDKFGFPKPLTSEEGPVDYSSLTVDPKVTSYIEQAPPELSSYFSGLIPLSETVTINNPLYDKIPVRVQLLGQVDELGQPQPGLFVIDDGGKKTQALSVYYDLPDYVRISAFVPVTTRQPDTAALNPERPINKAVTFISTSPDYNASGDSQRIVELFDSRDAWNTFHLRGRRGPERPRLIRFDGGIIIEITDKGLPYGKVLSGEQQVTSAEEQLAVDKLIIRIQAKLDPPDAEKASRWASYELLQELYFLTHPALGTIEGSIIFNEEIKWAQDYMKRNPQPLITLTKKTHTF